jgi:hypothetical protein
VANKGVCTGSGSAAETKLCSRTAGERGTERGGVWVAAKRGLRVECGRREEDGLGGVVVEMREDDQRGGVRSSAVRRGGL